MSTESETNDQINLKLKPSSTRIHFDSDYIYGTVKSKDVLNVAPFRALKITENESSAEGKFTFQPHKLMIVDHVIYPNMMKYIFSGDENLIEG